MCTSRRRGSWRTEFDRPRQRTRWILFLPQLRTGKRFPLSPSLLGAQVHFPIAEAKSSSRDERDSVSWKNSSLSSRARPFARPLACASRARLCHVEATKRCIPRSIYGKLLRLADLQNTGRPAIAIGHANAIRQQQHPGGRKATAQPLRAAMADDVGIGACRHARRAGPLRLAPRAGWWRCPSGLFTGEILGAPG